MWRGGDAGSRWSCAGCHQPGLLTLDTSPCSPPGPSLGLAPMSCLLKSAVSRGRVSLGAITEGAAGARLRATNPPLCPGTQPPLQCPVPKDLPASCLPMPALSQPYSPCPEVSSPEPPPPPSLSTAQAPPTQIHGLHPLLSTCNDFSNFHLHTCRAWSPPGSKEAPRAGLVSLSPPETFPGTLGEG